MTGSSTEALASPRAKTARRSVLSLAVEGLRDIAQRRRLIRYLVGADLKRTHADTIFGQLWWIFDPLLQMAVYVVLVQVIFRVHIPDQRLSPWILLLPVVAAVQLVFTLALALSLAAMNAFYRDVQNVLRHLVRLWFYLSPGLWTIHDISDPTARMLLSLNPFTPLFESYRSITWGTQAPDWGGLLYVLVVSLLLLAFGLALFKRVEPAFARIL
jgi:ABC-type polysaccharide/polyol phosphate export permease